MEEEDYPVINIKEEEEEEEVINDIEPQPEPQEEEKIFTNIKSNRDKRLENLRKAREARKKKKEEKKVTIVEPVKTHITNEIDYERLISGVVNRLEDNRTKRKASKKTVQPVQQVQPVAEVNMNPYSSLFRF